MNKLLLALACMLLVPSIASSHHSSAMFDKSVLRDERVTVKEFQWTNPHVWIQIVLKNEQGEEEEWSIEGLGPNSLFRSGWRPNSFKPGDVIEIRFNPMRDGSSAGGFIGAKFADGRTLGTWK
jgi:hypothetical protein